MVRGRLIVDPYCVPGSGAVVSVLEDEYGDVVRLAVYNSPAANADLLPRHQVVAVKEPFYKQAADGHFVVRVDNPNEVMFLDQLDVSLEALLEQGNKHHNAAQYTDAAAAYSKALSTVTADKTGELLLSVLLNMSATHAQLQQPLHALLYAAAAAALTCYQHTKAYYRAAVAVDGLLGQISSSSSSNGSSNGADSPTDTVMPQQLVTAAKALMQTSMQLGGACNGPAKAQMLAALVHVAAAASRGAGGAAGRSGRGSGAAAAGSGAWDVAVSILAKGAGELQGCFTPAAAADAAADQAAGGKQKDAGNRAFTAGKYADALQHYQSALVSLKASTDSALLAVPILLSNRSACWLQLSSTHTLQHAFVDALSAALLDPSQVQPFYRAATALVQLDKVSVTESVLQLGFSILPAGKAVKPLRELQKRLQTAASATALKAQAKAEAAARQRQGGGSSGDWWRQTVSERDIKAMEREFNPALLELARANQDAAAHASEEWGDRDGLTEIIDNRIPPFHEEYSKAGRWPPLVDISWASDHLWEAYEYARALPRGFDDMCDPGTVTQQQLLQRLMGMDAERMTWLLSAPFGDVRFLPEFQQRIGYTGARQNWGNCPQPQKLALGKTHVAIGFVDLGDLASTCELLADQDPTLAAAAGADGSSSSSGSSGSSSNVTAAHAARNGSSNTGSGSSAAGGAGGPLRWVGYEMSPYCVSKTLVVLQMVEQGAAVDEILQVWYSAGWSKATLTAFRKAVTALLKTAAKRQPHPSAEALRHPDVLELLQHWQVKEVKLAAARRGWQEAQKTPPGAAANYPRREDRMALFDLVLTGELPGMGPADGGNVAMFAVPQEFGDRAVDESILKTVHFKQLVQAWREQQQQPGSTIVSVALDLLRQRTEALVGMLRAGTVTAEVNLAAVQLGWSAPMDVNVMSTIRSLQPATINWSNVPEYMGPANFHKLAQSISAPTGTVHHMHSVNWGATVKGAFHFDYMVSMDESKLEEVMSKMVEGGNSSIQKWYRSLGVQDALLYPPCENPRAIVDYTLFSVRYTAWMKAFFDRSISSIRDMQQQVKVVEPPGFNFLGRTNSIFHMVFSYDTKADLSGLAA